METMFMYLKGLAIGIGVCFFGGWDLSLEILTILVIIDYVSGICVAGIFHTSPKTKNGALESRAGLKGILKKLMMFALVVVATQIDTYLGTQIVRTALIGGLIANESLSILENATLMGLDVPDFMKNAIEIMADKKNNEKKDMR